MGLGQRKSKKSGKSKNRALGKHLKTKRWTKDFETVKRDFVKGVELPVDSDLPGHGQFYCIPCARYFVNSSSLMSHNKSKDHKKMLKRVKSEEAWTENHSMLAAEMTN
ncbi:putative bud site selection protein [Cryptosporidium felis]|nr:putative bud site selection protein [Cryptosporidium felis]